MHRSEETRREPSLEKIVQLLFHSQRQLEPRVSFPMVDERTLGMDVGE